MPGRIAVPRDRSPLPAPPAAGTAASAQLVFRVPVSPVLLGSPWDRGKSHSALQGRSRRGFNQRCHESPTPQIPRELRIPRGVRGHREALVPELTRFIPPCLQPSGLLNHSVWFQWYKTRPAPALGTLEHRLGAPESQRCGDSASVSHLLGCCSLLDGFIKSQWFSPSSLGWEGLSLLQLPSH